MSGGIDKFESLLSAWREASAKTETLKRFRDNGGQHRLRMQTDVSVDAIVGDIMNDMMQVRGYQIVLDTAIRTAEGREAAAKAAFHEASGDEIPRHTPGMVL